jgi:hypothetical protein
MTAFYRKGKVTATGSTENKLHYFEAGSAELCQGSVSTPVCEEVELPRSVHSYYGPH